MSTTTEATSTSPVRVLPGIARILLGLIFFVFGLNGFLQFLPQPKEMPEAATSFFMAMVKTGYLIPLLFGTQTLVGALLLLNRFVPLALALIAPVILNIVLFHVAVVPSGLPLAIVVLALELYLAWSYRGAFRSMLAFRAKPTACGAEHPAEVVHDQNLSTRAAQ